jgi:tRNA pseudouridine55 synthase
MVGSMHVTEPDGILLLDKPQGFTSHDAVAWMRRKLQMKRIGHAGTLDPMATGLLVLLIGKATKASQYMMGMDKVYEGTIELGKTTNSYDAEGEVMSTAPVPPLTEAEVLAYMKGFMGDQMQVPPMFSAIKKDGVPLYKLARKGEEVEREERFIRISEFALIKFESPFITFRLACTKGTYVRTVAHDLGGRIGCGGTLVALRRTAIEKFTLARALTPQQIEPMSSAELAKYLVPVHEAIPPGWH